MRAAYGYASPNGVRIHVAGIDVVRDEDGEFRVLEDNLRSPSCVSYVLANRAAMARVLPELFWGQPIQMVNDYPARLINALRRAAPASVQDPTVVVITPGVHNSAFYEHALLARLMGVHLVEGRDLVCHGTDVFLRTTEGEVPVHVSTDVSMTSTSIRCNSGPSPWWGVPGWSTRHGRAGSPLPTRSGMGLPTTSSSTPTCPP